MTVLPLPVALLERRLALPMGALEGVDLAAAEDAIADATAAALAEVGCATATRWAGDVPPIVQTVILKAARREYENPRGLRTESLGEHSATVSVASGAYLTEVERALVRQAATGRPCGFVGTVRLISPYADALGEDPDTGDLLLLLGDL